MKINHWFKFIIGIVFFILWVAVISTKFTDIMGVHPLLLPLLLFAIILDCGIIAESVVRLEKVFCKKS